jgi:hypothetical protein
MDLHRARADADVPPDLLVGLVSQKAVQHLAFPLRHLGNASPRSSGLVIIPFSRTNVSCMGRL